MTTSILDVARYILEQYGPMTAMKLEKLCYYSQAWSLVWVGSPLFSEEFEAWANSPVCPTLFDKHRHMFTVSAEDIPGDSSKLSPEQKETVDVVVEAYGPLDAYQLSTLTHTEAPWINARGDTPSGARSNSIISRRDMEEYYGSFVDEA